MGLFDSDRYDVVIFIDVVNSMNVLVDFISRLRIFFFGKVYKIVKVIFCYVIFENVYYWEIEVV